MLAFRAWQSPGSAWCRRSASGASDSGSTSDAVAAGHGRSRTSMPRSTHAWSRRRCRRSQSRRRSDPPARGRRRRRTPRRLRRLVGAQPPASFAPRGNDGQMRPCLASLRVVFGPGLSHTVHRHTRIELTASSIVSAGTGAATMHGYCEALKSVIARVPLQPRRMCCQNRSRPTPNGDTTPIPVIATRGMPALIPL